MVGNKRNVLKPAALMLGDTGWTASHLGYEVYQSGRMNAKQISRTSSFGEIVHALGVLLI